MSQLRVGQRVEATDAYRIAHPGASSAGIVVAIRLGCVVVLRDRLTAAASYPARFWRPEQPPPGLAAFARECEGL